MIDGNAGWKGLRLHVREEGWAEGLATMIRIMLMYYVNLYTFLEDPEKDWAKLLSDADPLPEEPLLFC